MPRARSRSPSLAVCWAVSLYLWPFATCGRCRGKRTNAGSNRKRWGACKRCGGTGQRQRLGSKAVHRIARHHPYHRKRKDK